MGVETVNRYLTGGGVDFDEIRWLLELDDCRISITLVGEGDRFRWRYPSGVALTLFRSIDFKTKATIPTVVQIECVLFGPFREDVGEKTVTLETDAETVGELLVELERRYPVLSGRLVDDDSIAGETVVTKDKRDVRHIDGLETAVDADAVFRLVPSVYGG